MGGTRDDEAKGLARSSGGWAPGGLEPRMTVAVCCVTENRPTWYPKVLNLVWSVRAFGGRLADAKIVVCVVDDCDRGFREGLEKFGASVRVVPPVDPIIRYTNKLRMLELDDLGCDVLLALDCDTVLVGDPSPYLDSSAIGLKPVDRNYLSDDQWRRLYGAVHLSLPAKEYRTTTDAEPIHAYFNSGVAVVPALHARRLAGLWHRYVLELAAVYQRDPELALWRRFNDQFALSCALIEGGFPVRALPVSMNFPTHVRVDRSLAGGIPDPLIIHYHTDLDDRGFLVRSRYETLNHRIDRFNRSRAEEFHLEYPGLLGPPLLVRLRRNFADHRLLQGQRAERVKQRLKRFLARMGWSG
jgi:hypothetical protein